MNQMEYSVEGRKSRLEAKIPIPNYTLGEELVNAISHGIGAGLGVAALCLCVRISAIHGTKFGCISSWIFGISLIILYSMSCIYHSLKPNNAKRVMRICDHCTIFLLIAGTYTPFTLISLRGSVGWTLFGIIWGAAVIGIVLNAIDMERFKIFSMICYLAMGWTIVLKYHDLSQAVDIRGIRLLVAGGIAYTVGAIIFGIGSKVKYMHSLWHFFVLAGSILHFLCIYMYVL
ncbi:MAG: hemolysin III family protein [Lachnospiraceae bacterium]|nr:hemolysin III family protein [Lachnospiraceae bacterium]